MNKTKVLNQGKKVLVKGAETTLYGMAKIGQISHKVAEKPGKAALGLVAVSVVGVGALCVNKSTNNPAIRKNTATIVKVGRKILINGMILLTSSIASNEIVGKVIGGWPEDETEEETEEETTEEETTEED